MFVQLLWMFSINRIFFVLFSLFRYYWLCADCEEFKVKKSSHSKRIAKQLKREKKGEDQVDSKEASLPRDQPGIVDPHGGDDVERAINLKV